MRWRDTARWLDGRGERFVKEMGYRSVAHLFLLLACRVLESHADGDGRQTGRPGLDLLGSSRECRRGLERALGLFRPSPEEGRGGAMLQFFLVHRVPKEASAHCYLHVSGRGCNSLTSLGA